MLAVFHFYHRTQACNLTGRENLQNSDCPFRFLFELVRLCSRYNKVLITAPGMFTNLCLVLLLLLAGSLVPKFFSFNQRKKAGEKSQKRSDIVQFGRWRDNFSLALCYMRVQSTLFQPITARDISELYCEWSSCPLQNKMVLQVFIHESRISKKH